jgi:uncharacterized membrane protein
LKTSIAQPLELWQTTYHWLQQTGNKPNRNYCRQEITTHPDYPAMTAVTDFLERGGMRYDAVQADASYIYEFNYPLLAHIKQPGNEYLHLITNVGEWDRGKIITQNWSGIVLYASKDATWHFEENDDAEKATLQTKYIAAAFVLAGFALFIGSIFINTNAVINIFGLLSLVGLAISIAALGTELGYQSKLVKQVCGIVGNGGCEKVLGSKFAKGFAGITPADASVLYFAAQFILYLAGCFYNPILISIVNIAFAGVIVAAWSIYTQAVKLKEWCALCLCIVTVLVGQIIIAFMNVNTANFAVNDTYLFFAVTTSLLTIAYLPIKQLIKTNSKNKQELATFKKWKTDGTLFFSQWEKEPACDNSIWENDLLIGNVDAPIRITVACNPYCEPCAKAHIEFDKLVEKYPGKISVQVRLLCKPNNEIHTTTIATTAILQVVNNVKVKKELQIMLTDWFEWMDLEKWNSKWNNDNGIDVMDTLEKHNQWMIDNGISHTPTLFINGKKLPGKYYLKDIEKLIPQLEYTFNNKIVNNR